METLLEALTQYAEENLVVRYLREYAPQIQTAQLREERLTESWPRWLRRRRSMWNS